MTYTHWKVCFYNESPANRNKNIIKAEVTIKINIALSLYTNINIP